MQHAVEQEHAAAATMLLALPIALEHPTVSTDVRMLCTAAQVCKAWQMAVLQCGSSNTAVVLGPNAPPQQLAGFVRWLRKHAKHVCSISISVKDLPFNQHEVHGMLWERYMALQQQLLCLAMRAASLAASPSLQDSTGQQLWQQQRAWRLASFSSDLPRAAGLLPLLPAHSLTYLSLDLQHDTAVAADSSALSSALAGLSNLRFLRLNSTCNDREAVHASCLAGIAQLRQLTELQLHNCWSNIDQPLQQLLAQPLPLRKLLLHVRSDLPDLNLAHLTQLEVLEHTWGALTPRSVLPLQLQRLQLGAVECAADLEALIQLPSLQWLSILVRTLDHALLLQLAKHPSLQELALRYDGSKDVVATMAAWDQLPQLRELQLVWENSIPNMQQARNIVFSIAECTSLTNLLLTAQAIDEDDPEDDGWDAEPPPATVRICFSLAALTNLKHLELDCTEARLEYGDAEALTALTNLTCLVSRAALGVSVRPRGQGVRGAAVVAVARSLKQLRHLELDECNMQDKASLAAVGQLTQLTELQLMGVGGVTLEGLNLLTGLSRLQQLTLQTGREVPDDVLQQFAQRLGIRKAVSKQAASQSALPVTYISLVPAGDVGGEGFEWSGESDEGDEYEDEYEEGGDWEDEEEEGSSATASDDEGVEDGGLSLQEGS